MRRHTSSSSPATDEPAVRESAVLRLLAGGSPAEVGREVGVDLGVLAAWRRQFVTAGRQALRAGTAGVSLGERERAAGDSADEALRGWTLLMESGRELGSSLDYRTTLESVARLAVPGIADWCVVDVLGEDGTLDRPAVVHVDADREETARGIQRRYPPRPDVAAGPFHVMRTRRPELVETISEALLERVAQDAEHLELLREAGLVSYMSVPMIARGRVVGAITCFTAQSGRIYGPGDLALLQHMAGRAALAIDNARLHRRAQEALEAREESLALLGTLFTRAPVGLAFLDRELRYVRVNDVVAEMIGLPRQQIVGRVLTDLFPDAQADFLAMLQRVLDTRRPVIDVEVSGDTSAAPGVVRHWLAGFYPVARDSGEVLGVGLTAVDITDRKRAEHDRSELLERERAARERAEAAGRRLGLLASAGQLLGASLDFEDTLATLARLLVPDLAQGCAVDLVDDGSLRRVTVAHADADRERLLWRLRREYPPLAAELEVMASGRAAVLAAPSDEQLRDMATSGEHLELLRALQVGPGICVPLSARGRVLGTLSLMRPVEDPPFADDEVRVAEEIAQRAALAIDNARLHDDRVEQGRFARSVLDSLAARTAVLDATGTVTAANRAWQSCTEARADGWCSPPGSDYLATCDAAGERGVTQAGPAAAGIRRVLAGDCESFQVEYPSANEWFVLRVTPLRTDAASQAGPRGVVVAHHDITWRKQAEVGLQRRAEQQEAVAQLGVTALTDLGMSTLLDQAVTLVANVLHVDYCQVRELSPDGDALILRAGVGWRDDAIGTSVIRADMSTQAGCMLASALPVVVEDLSVEARFPGSAFLAEHGVVSGVSVLIQGWDRPFGILGAHTAQRRAFDRDDVNFVQAIANVLGGAIERRRSEDDARHRAMHDPLTGLPNRTLLGDRLEQALTAQPRTADDVGVLFIDLDDFKAVNDSLGHAAGDQLLAALVPRLQHALRPNDTIARFGGDEFVIVCPGLDEPEDALTIADRVIASLADPIPLPQAAVTISASIGIALAGAVDTTAEELLRRADAAMYQAKRHGGSRHEVFEASLSERAHERLRIANDLRGAVERGELHLAYQPIVGIVDGRIIAVEALLRWHHPHLGPIPPARFIPIAEETGLIVPIGAWVLGEVCRQASRWRHTVNGHAPPRVYVNLSARQLADPNFIDVTEQALQSSGVPAQQIGFEITESQLLGDDGDEPLGTLAILKHLGVTLAIDDFGTGYSSLSQLKRMPLDILKIDRGFVDGVGHDPDDSAIVTAVIAMARALRLQVVAEGVETKEEQRTLSDLGCDYAQGFHFARPLPAEDITVLLT